MLIDYFVVGLGFTFFVAYGMVKWFLGQRQQAMYYFELAANTLVYIFVVQLVLWAAVVVAGQVGISVPLTDVGSVSSSFNSSADTFWQANRRAVDTIIAVQIFRAGLAAVPIVSPLSSVVGAATGWSISELGVVAIVYLHLTFLARVLSVLAPYLLFFGSTLAPIPRLRKIGVALLTTYIALTVGVLYAGAVTQQVLDSAPPPPNLVNPLDWVRIAAITSDIAIYLGEALTYSLVAIALSSAIGAGLSFALGGVYVSLGRV